MHMNTTPSLTQRVIVSILVAVMGLVVSAPVFAADVLLASVAITASPASVCSGQPVRIAWSSTDATSVWIDQGIGSVLPYGERYVYPTQTATYTITGTNTTGGYAVATATVYVNSTCGTPTPTPTPYDGTLYCSAVTSYANSGDLVSFNAWGGNGNYSWYTSEGSPTYGNYSNFVTRYYNYANYAVNRNVTVTSGYQTVTCGVTVYGNSYVTPTPTPAPYAHMTIAETGRNVTRGQSGEYAIVSARGGDTLDLIIRVRSTNGSSLYNAYVTDQLPAGLNYISGSTTLNGTVVADGVTSTGIYIGTVSPYSASVVKFSVRVDGAYVPASTMTTVYSIAQARADSMSTISASLPIVLGQNAVITSVSSVKTGPADSVMVSLLLAALATAAYAAYTRTLRFQNRLARVEIARLTQSTGLNFKK